MSEFINSEKAGQMDKPTDNTINTLDQILGSEGNYNWVEVLDSTSEDAGELANSRLAISGLYGSQAEAAGELGNNINPENVDEIVITYIKEFDDQIKLLSDDGETLKNSFRNNTLNTLTDDEVREYIKKIIDINNNKPNISNELSILNEWVSAVRMEIVEDLWGSVKDYHENHDMPELKQTITQAQERLRTLAKGSIFLK